jgi:LAS superfamily LD-carboxypeptidase LdcB
MTTARRRIWAYERGQRTRELVVVPFGGVLLTPELVALFASMQAAAAADGVELVLTDGVRTHEEQTRLYLERMDQPGDDAATRARKAELRRVRGIAARPGWSRHQSGHALDVRTGLTAAAFRRGERTPTYRWLEEHAPRFGFRVLAVKDEPWHLEAVMSPAELAGAGA